MKKLLVCFASFALLLVGCHSAQPETDGTKIQLADGQITVDGKSIKKDADQAVYAANDIVFYLAGQGITYGEGEQADEHQQSEADSHTVVHITKPGTYIISGKLSAGQIAVDLGEDAKKDPDAVVTLVLNGADITCTVAPAVIFYNVYECCSSDEESAKKDLDTSKAGANVIIADGSQNNINGAYVAKIYKSYQLSDDGTEVVDSKKLHKYDGAFYSKMTMNISGEKKGDGILNIRAENEGLDSELHLTVNGGIINITSGNDGINTNEDGVSVTTINGGTVNILCNGATGEGDGIDSNGWLVINGGTVISQACATSGDAGIDSDNGIYINGGKVIATGNMLDRIAGGEQTYAVFQFAGRQNGGTYTLKDATGKVVAQYAPTNAFTYLIVADDGLKPGDYTLWMDQTQLAANRQAGQGGMPGGQWPDRPEGDMPEGQRPEMPEGMTPPDGMGGFPDGMTPPDGQRPERPDGEMPEGMTPPNGMGGFPEGMTPPDGMGEFPGGMIPGGTGGFPDGTAPGGEASTTFTITAGGNQFVNVAPATT